MRLVGTMADRQEVQAGHLKKDFHVAIIMDGNGRWARLKNMFRAFGHAQGVEALRRTIEAAPKLAISHLTVYAFSTENWKRPEQEIKDLLGLLKTYIKSDLARLHENGVCVRIIGDRTAFGSDILAAIDEAEQKTRDNKEFYLQVALNYGARHDLLCAMQSLAKRVEQGLLAASDISQDMIEQALTTHDLPPLDLLIRTSGEYRLSNFLLWESAYAEFVFQEILWPDYGPEPLKAALDTYKKRDRRFGAIVELNEKTHS